MVRKGKIVWYVFILPLVTTYFMNSLVCLMCYSRSPLCWSEITAFMPIFTLIIPKNMLGSLEILTIIGFNYLNLIWGLRHFIIFLLPPRLLFFHLLSLSLSHSLKMSIWIGNPKDHRIWITYSLGSLITASLHLQNLPAFFSISG